MVASTAVTVFLSLLLLIRAAAVASPPSPSPPPPPPDGCAREIVLLSPCLPYVSSPPNDLALRAPPLCCAALSFAHKSGFVSCLCYLVLKPAMLGFPLNKTRLRSLHSDCSLADVNSTGNATVELDSLCSGSPRLPPLRGTNGSDIETLPENSPLSAPSPLQSVNGTSFSSDVADIAPPVPATLLAPATSSSSELQINQPMLLACLLPSSALHSGAFLKHMPFI